MASGYYPIYLRDPKGKLLKGAIALIDKALKPSPYGYDYAECSEDAFSDGAYEEKIRLARQFLLETFILKDRAKIKEE